MLSYIKYNILIAQNAADIPFYDMGFVLYPFVYYYVILGVFFMSMTNVCMCYVVYLTRSHTHDSRITHVQPAQSRTRVGDENLSNSVRKTSTWAFAPVAHYVYRRASA